MSSSENIVKFYCSYDQFQIQHIANRLETNEIEFQINGATSSLIMGPTEDQLICIHIFGKDLKKAKKTLEKLRKHLKDRNFNFGIVINKQKS